MGRALRVDIQVYYGPNLIAPFQAVVAEVESPFIKPMDAAEAQGTLAKLLPQDLGLRITVPQAHVRFEQLAALIANALLDLNGPAGLPHDGGRRPGGKGWVALGFYVPDAAKFALTAGIDLAASTFSRAGGGQVERLALRARAREAVATVARHQPDYIARSLIGAAQSRGIPVYPLLPGARIWQYGQGARGHQLFEAATHGDGLVGVRISHNKIWSNRFIRQLGLPGVTHAVARNAPHARRLAAEIGFPVVVKPATGGKGKGITVGVEIAEEIDAAFARAEAFAPGGVLIEGFVAGEDYRLSVFGNKLMRASRLTPAYVVCDGKRSIQQLIDDANRDCRNKVPSTVSLPVSADGDVIAIVGQQGFRLSDRPSADTKVYLRKTANVHTGGTRQDMTDSFHPDNVAMAEAIARNFHLDAAGIDFITPDPSMSWREVPCAVIEVNATPGIGDHLAARILEQKFPGNSDGRIPAVLLLDAPTDFASRLLQVTQRDLKGIGFTDGRTTSIDGVTRFEPTANLPDRILGLLVDSACEALIVSSSAEDVLRYGVPHTRFDLVLGGRCEGPAREAHGLVGQHSAKVLDIDPSSPNDDALAEAAATLKALLGGDVQAAPWPRAGAGS